MKNTLIKVVFPLFIAIMFLTAAVSGVQAKVEANWPDEKPNTPRYEDDIFFGFEEGIDGIEIFSTNPSLKFTTTAGVNWKYADIRTGNYNVNPYNAANYETNGNFFAWLGVAGDAGRVDFLGGGATYCSILVSTSSGVVMEAYDSSGQTIADSGWAGNNLGTGTVTRLTVEAPKGENIAYVIIHDTGNYWSIDDLCTDANKVILPVPDRAIGKTQDKYDLVFVPAKDYGSAEDIDKWLPTFLGHVKGQIDERLGAADPVTGNLCKFNFYYTKLQGTAIPGTNELPADLTRLAPYAQAYVILHKEQFGDFSSGGAVSTFGAEGVVGRSFIHEAGHGVFGLADEYDGCGTYYFQPDPNPNIWATEALCRTDATSEKWTADDCGKFTNCQNDWWKIGTTEYIMKDGNDFANGWGVPSTRRIKWFLEQYPSCKASKNISQAYQEEKSSSIWLDIHVLANNFTLEDEGYITAPAPDYLPGEYEFTVKVFSVTGELLNAFGIHDPRRVLAEEGYVGETLLDDINFQLVVPYYNSGARVELIESATGVVKLSIDISKYVSDEDEYDEWDLDNDNDVDKDDAKLLKVRQKDEKNALKVKHSLEKAGMKEASCNPDKDHHCYYNANFDLDGDYDVDKDDSKFLKLGQKEEKNELKLRHKAEKDAVKAAM